MAFFGKRPPNYPEPVYQQTRVPQPPRPPAPAAAPTPAPVRPPTAFLSHLARGIAYGIGVTVGVVLVVATLGLVLLNIIHQALLQHH